ncbi:MAG: hypothetical protein CMQ43_03085 [Gammaproteobacteria bacterium]|nr:hypothetical protein [Gammaproteobacteria bacterium]MBK79888.1 hypothetical protein [Gammaproteobacteria bacterium]|tara:strand:- start:15198 stop:16115 length:918 start_codon:yes stop_codon:yes gene_type:complete
MASTRQSVAILAIAGLWVLPGALAQAVTVYDVIALTRADIGASRIIEVMDATGARFALSAEDVLLLDQVGVEEAVIQRMLEAAVAPAQLRSTEMPAVARTARTDRETVRSPVFGVVDAVTADDTAATDDEARALTLGGLPILILRDRGSYASTALRARVLADRLARLMSVGDGRFEASVSDMSASIVFVATGGETHPVLEATAADALAYDRRSVARVTPTLLGRYWAAVLEDFTGLAVRGREPRRLDDLHQGDAIVLLDRAMRAVRDADGRTTMATASTYLPGPVRQHLAGLAGSVPEDFERLGR